MTKLSALRKRLEKEAGFMLPLALGAGGTAAWFNREKIKMLLSNLGIGHDTIGDYEQGSKYTNPQVAELAQRVLSRGAS